MLARLLLILLLLPTLTFSQIQRKFSSYTADDGLNQNSIYETIQDYRGYLWFSTANGISRFDGYEMHNYKYNPKDTSSIYGEFYFTFFEDSKKQLWVSHDKGLSYYNRVTNNFVNVIKLDAMGSYRVYNILAEDRFNQLWILIANKTLVSFDINNKRIIEQYELEDIESHEATVQKTCILHNDILVFQNKSYSLYSLNTRTKKLQKLTSTGIQRVEFAKHNANTFIAVDALNSKILEIKFKNQEITSREYPINLLGNWITSSIANVDNKYYVGTLDGLIIMNKDNFNKTEYVKNFGQYAKSFMFMESIYVDKTKNVIFGTNGMGVRVYSPHVNKFIHIGSNEEQLNMTKSILVSKSGKIFVGLHAIGFVVIDKNDNYNYKHINFEPTKIRDKSNSHVYAITEYSDDEILIVYSDRMIVYNHVKNKISKTQKKHYDIIQSSPTFVKHKNEIYVNITDHPTYYISKVNNDLSNTKIFEIEDSLITSFKFYNDSILLVGTTKGFIIHNFKSKKNIATIGKIFVKSILITKKNEIYFSTIKGLYKTNTDADIIEYYDESNGMNNDNIYGILEDVNNNLWFSHNKGLSVLNPTTKKINNFTNADGLQSNEFNTGSFTKDNNGLLYFGGTNGINIIDPNDIHYNPYPPNVSLNKIYLFDEEYKTDTFYNELNVLNLNYTQNTLAFDFSALDFSNPTANKYKYILEGYDKSIIESGTRHYARYANLPPGNYVLKLYGSNNDGVWSTQPKIIRINIIPPYWQTTWFYWLVGLTIVLSVVGLIYIFINQQKQKLKRKLEIQRELEIERLRISRDLHDHVGAQLSYLISNLDWIVSHPDALDKEEELRRLSNLSDTGRQAILTLRQTIWALNNSELSVEEFADKFKSFAKKMLEFSANIHISFHENITKNNVISPGVALNLFRICQEALGNALKHSKASQIDVQFNSNEYTSFEFILTDNGVGFDTNNFAKEDHYGLLNMKSRAEEANAELLIESEIGKGTTVKIRHLYYMGSTE